MGIPALYQDSVNNRLALKLYDSNSETYSSEHLQEARKIGIDILEVSFPTEEEESVLNEFYLLIDTDLKFLTVHELREKQDVVLSAVQNQLNAVPIALKDNIAAVKLFTNPADYDDRFPTAIQNLNLTQSSYAGTPLYYQSAFTQPKFKPAVFSFVAGRYSVSSDTLANPQEPVLLFEPSDDLHKSLQALQNILNRSLFFPESIIIIPAEWFFTRMENEPAFSAIISSYLEGNSVSFPFPEDKREYPIVNWPVVFLLAIWASFIIHYKYQPMYKATLPRYFFNHSFFVHDIMKNRIRSSTSGLIVLFQHSLLTGFFFYLIADSFFTDTGLQSLASHFPAIIFSEFEYISIFFAGFILSFLSHIISILWLHFFNNKLQKLYQTINLYCWPLHLNLIIVTLVVYLAQASDGNSWLIAATVLYFLIWFISFTIAATDSAKYLEKYRPLFLIATIGIHTLLVTTVCILLFWLPDIYEPIKMVFLMP